jgi:hypothetical protein
MSRAPLSSLLLEQSSGIDIEMGGNPGQSLTVYVTVPRAPLCSPPLLRSQCLRRTHAAPLLQTPRSALLPFILGTPRRRAPAPGPITASALGPNLGTARRLQRPAQRPSRSFSTFMSHRYTSRAGSRLRAGSARGSGRATSRAESRAPAATWPLHPPIQPAAAAGLPTAAAAVTAALAAAPYEDPRLGAPAGGPPRHHPPSPAGLQRPGAGPRALLADGASWSRPGHGLVTAWSRPSHGL